MRGIIITLVAAVATFCVVQDRITAAGARRYVQIERDAAAAHGAATVTVDDVMTPAIHAGVRDGLLSAAAVVVAGAGIMLRGRRRGER